MALVLAPPLALGSASDARAGILPSPDGTYEIWYSQDWYPGEPGELIPNVDPGCCSIVVLAVADVGETNLLEALKTWVKENKGGKVLDSGAFGALGERDGAYVHAVRLRGNGMYQMLWAAVPLDTQHAAVVTLRTVNSSLTTRYRDDFFAMAGTAARPGLLQDGPLEDLRVALPHIDVPSPASTPAPSPTKGPGVTSP